MGKNFTFTEEQISGLFGELAAEDENKKQFKNSFFKSDTYDKVHNNRPLRILVAHKGIGKSAIFRMSYEENIEQQVLALWIRPNDIADLCSAEDNETALSLIEKWKSGLNKRIVELIIRDFKTYFENDYINTLINRGVRLLDAITSIIRDIDDKIDLDGSKKLIIERYLKNRKIVIYIDDLDRAWEGSKANINRIAALLNAVRDLTNESEGLHFRISLRSDVYYLVRTADESTDKIGGNVIWLSWTEHELLIFLVKRIQNYLGNKLSEVVLLEKTQFEVARYLDDIMDCYFMGAGKWQRKRIHYVLLSLIRRRPRDLINLCTQAAREAKSKMHSRIETSDWEDIFDRYSLDRLQDTINEHKYELPEVERLLLGMKPSRNKKRLSGSAKYTDDQLISKINGIIQRGKFEFSNGKVATPKELITFMYKINFLIARKDAPDGYVSRKYFEDNRYLSTEHTLFGYEWEIHPAFRWALHPESRDIFAEIDIPSLN